MLATWLNDAIFRLCAIMVLSPMSEDQINNRPSSKWLSQALRTFLGLDVIAIIDVIWRLGKQIVPFKSHEGMYDVLECDSCLELLDSKGVKAIIHKRQKVRFLQDNIMAYQDKAWGDGEIFADYKCSPGVAVDRYRDGHRYRILISLRKMVNRGDTEEFHIERTIKDGFTKEVEDFQTEIDHTTQKLSISVIFPRKRSPKQVFFTERNTTRTRKLGPENQIRLPDGRQKVIWSTERPKLFEAYILRWEW